jgi:hypothetical protein
MGEARRHRPQRRLRQQKRARVSSRTVSITVLLDDCMGICEQIQWARACDVQPGATMCTRARGAC